MNFLIYQHILFFLILTLLLLLFFSTLHRIVRNPPPLCAGIPHLQKYASVCLVFYNITWDQKAGGCIKLDAKLAGITLEEIDIGCFFYPFHGGDQDEAMKHVWQKHVLRKLKKMSSLVTKKIICD